MSNRVMKDSGIDWIGKIPQNWDISKVGYVLKRSNKLYVDGTTVLSLYREYGVIPKDSRDDNYNVTSEDLSKYRYVNIGDLVVNKMKAWQGSLAVSNYNGVVSPAYFVYNFYKNNVYVNYIHYLLRSTYKDEFKRLSGGIRVGQWDLPANLFEKAPIILPPLKEQKLIADYLDNKCSEIDKLKEDITKQIDILKEYKQSIITEAVTKGLDSNVPMKDSGIDWIGKIPEKWKVTKIKYVSNLSGRIGWQGLTSNEYSDTGAYLITGIDFDNSTINWKTCVHIPFERWEEAKQIQIENGDLLITKDGTVGKVALVNNMPDKTSLNSGVLLIRTFENCNTKFLFWVLKSNIFWKWFYKINAGNSTIIHLYQKDFANFSFPIMNLSEQKIIANYLDSKCSEIDKVISSKEKQVNILEEYKRSLIYEYVTGKKEVPQES